MCRQKRVRFPKGKKARPGDEAVNRGRPEEGVGVGIGPTPLTDPRSAAEERAKRRSQITTELFSEETAGILNDISAAEVTYRVCVIFRIRLIPLQFSTLQSK